MISSEKTLLIAGRSAIRGVFCLLWNALGQKYFKSEF